MFSFLTPDATKAGEKVAAAIDRLTEALERLLPTMTTELQKLVDALTAHNTVEAGVLELLKSLHDQLVAAKDDPAKILELASEVQAHTQELADAITANTPTP